MTRIPALVLPALAIAGLIAGCGSKKDSSAPAASTPAPAASTTATPASTTPQATTAAQNKITVDGSEFKFDPSDINAKAGKLKITLNNTGKAPHELVVLKTDQAAASLKVTNGRVSEKGSVGEISETKPGATASHNFDLAPGRYVIICNIPGHYSGGMHGTITVQ